MRRVSRITLITLASVLAVPVALTTASATASAEPAAAAAKAAQGSVTYHGVPGTASRITALMHRAAFTVGHAALDPPTVSSPDLRPLVASASDGTPAPGQSAAAASSAASPSAAAIRAASMRVGGTSRILHNLDGLASANTAAVNDGRVVTPPDQGLCTGRDASLAGHPVGIWEAVNDVARETAPDGTVLRSDVNLTTLFSDPFNIGDVRCVWDQQTQSFIFTSIGFPLGTGPNASETNTTVDITVLNRNGFASYQVDSSQGGQCLGDQPTTGFNQDSLVVSVNEFCGPRLNEFEGPLVLVISMRDLRDEAATLNTASAGPVLFLNGNLVISFDPVYGTDSNTEFIVNSFPFNSSGNRHTGNSLGLWKLSDTSSVTSGQGSPSLTGMVIASEAYPFPIPAQSTGDGSLVRVVHTPRGDRFVISEKFLTANDSRLNTQIQELSGPGGQITLFAALNTAVTPAGDTAARDAGAWFEIDANAQAVVDQGYIDAAGLNVLFPVIATAGGTTALGFTVTSSTVNPSSAFTTLGSGAITIVAAGTGPHLSFADGAPFFRARWGDYTAASVLPGAGGIWFATEYVPPLADQGDTDNWGTSVFEISH